MRELSTHPARQTAPAERLLTAWRPPIATVCVDLDPAHFANVTARQAQIAALVDQARRDGAAEPGLTDLEAALDEHAAEGRGLIGFADGQGRVEVVELPCSITSEVRVSPLPHLLPLLAATGRPRWCVAAVTRRSARLLTGDDRGLAEREHLAADVHRRHSRGGWAGLAQSRMRRSIEHDVQIHLERTASALLALQRHDAFDRCVSRARGSCAGR